MGLVVEIVLSDLFTRVVDAVRRVVGQLSTRAGGARRYVDFAASWALARPAEWTADYYEAQDPGAVAPGSAPSRSGSASLAAARMARIGRIDALGDFFGFGPSAERARLRRSRSVIDDIVLRAAPCVAADADSAINSTADPRRRSICTRTYTRLTSVTPRHAVTGRQPIIDIVVRVTSA